METADFLTWLILIGTLAVIGIGTMVYAYRGQGSLSVLFDEPLSLPPALPDSDSGTEACVQFQEGYNAYKGGQYRQAIDYFTQAIHYESNLAQAYHNRGLAYANLRQDDDSVVNLLSASELYSQQDNKEALLLIKQHLQAIKARKLERDSLE
jgi:tetratricopeptide (TPR) repeat protein